MSQMANTKINNGTLVQETSFACYFPRDVNVVFPKKKNRCYTWNQESLVLLRYTRCAMLTFFSFKMSIFKYEYVIS